MKYLDLRDFIAQAENKAMKRIRYPADPILEITEICDRSLKRQAPALLFENPKGYSIPPLANLSGRRIAWR